jgi:hypothetical protein
MLLLFLDGFYDKYIVKISIPISHNVLAVCDLSGRRRFGGPDKGLRSKTMSAKMWMELSVGMKRNGMT